MHLKTICNKILRTFSYNTTKHSKQGNKTMAKTPINPKDVYELMENDQGEIMLLLYAGETAPQKASFHLNEERKCIELYRNPKDTVIIEGLEKDSIIKLKQAKILYICEIKYNENPDSENEILYAYPTNPIKAPQQPKSNVSQTAEPSISEKAKQAREKILKKA